MDDIEPLAERIRRNLSDRGDLTEDRVFDGLGFFIDGRLVVAILGDGICVQFGGTATPPPSDSIAQPFQFAGRPVPGWVVIPSDQLHDDALAEWVGVGLANVASAM